MASAKTRAEKAIRILRTAKDYGRDFEDCFEMGDGEQVVAEIRRQAATDPSLVAAIRRHGFGVWLEPVSPLVQQ